VTLEEEAAKLASWGGGSASAPPVTEYTDEVARLVKWPSQGPQVAAPPPPAPKREPSPTEWAWAHQKTDPLARAARGVTDKMLGAGQFVANMFPKTMAEPVNRFIREDEKVYQQNRETAGNTGIDVSRGVGGGLATAALVPGGVARSFGGAALQGGAQGAVGGALDPVYGGDFWDQKKKQVGIGAGAGALAGLGGYGLFGRAPTQQAQRLIDEGINPTIGQRFGGWARNLEEKAKSLPILGNVIRGGEQGVTDQLNRAAWNRGLSHVGQRLPDGVAGHEASSEAHRLISNHYDDLITRIGSQRVDGQFRQELTNVAGMLNGLPQDVGQRYAAIIQREITERVDANGRLTGEAIKAAESRLGELARGFHRSNADDQMLGDAVQESQRVLRSWLARQSPQHARELRAVNTAYANNARPTRAAASLGADEGTFTAAQLHGAVKATDRSKNNAAFSRGEALMQDLSGPAKSVMTPRVPDSGTAGRGLMAGYMTNPLHFLGPVMYMDALASMPASLLYSNAGRAALNAGPEIGGLLGRSGAAIAGPLSPLLLGQ
jgi:hypothetical protein